MPASRATSSQSLPGRGYAGIEALAERSGVHLQEDMQNRLARVFEATENLVPVGVADERHRDDERVRVVSPQ